MEPKNDYNYYNLSGGDMDYKPKKSLKYLYGILIAIKRGFVFKLSKNNEWRAILSVLLSNELVESKITCKDIADKINSEGELIPRRTASRSRQWKNIKLSPLNSELELIPNGSKIHYLVNQFCNDVPIDNFRHEDKVEIKQKLKETISQVINKLKDILFAKIFATTTDENEKFSISSKRELFMYQYLTSNIVFGQHSPNIATFIFSKYCLRTDMSDIFKSQSIYPSRDEKRNVFLTSYRIIMTEQMEESDPTSNYIKKFKNNISEIREMDDFIPSYLFQLVFTLKVFNKINFIHNDLHAKNIMVEKLDNPTNFFYIFTKDNGDIIKIVNVKTKYFMRIFDFDRSFIEGDVNYKNQFRYYDGGKFTKYDFFWHIIWLQEQLKVLETMGNTDSVTTNYFNEFNRLVNIILGKSGTDNNYSGKSPYSSQITVPFKLTDLELNDIYSNTKSLDAFITWLFTNNDNFFIKKAIDNSTITFYDDLSKIPINYDSEIFFYPGHLNYLSKHISKNENWNRLNIYEKLVVCAPFVDDKEYKKNILYFSLINSNLETKLLELPIKDLCEKYFKNHHHRINSPHLNELYKKVPITDKNIINFDIKNPKKSLVKMIDAQIKHEDNILKYN